jgi:uncharacterized membrane-anchored protein
MTSATRNLAVKVPAVTAVFWIIKVLATTVGETFADFLNGLLSDSLHLTDTQGLRLVSGIMGAILVIVLIAQLRAKRYIPWLYWLTIVFISVAGTLISDNLTDGLGVPLWVTTLSFGVILAVVFAIWYSQEKTLAMKSILTTKREVFYWLAILFTFALGTSAGDQLAESANLGYALSLVVFAAAIGVVALLWRLKVLGEIAAFWIAYILTRPLGASLGDLLAQSPKDGGVGLGANNTSYLFLALILALVVYLTVSKRDRIK